MSHVMPKMKSALAAVVAVGLTVTGFAAAYLGHGGGADVAAAQTMGTPMSGPGAGGAVSMPPMPGGGGGTGGMMGPGMMGPGPGMMGGMGGAGARGSMVTWSPGFGEPTSTTRLHDYAPTASSTFYQKEQWKELSRRYELTMEWAHQLNIKWAPIEEAKLHYNLAAMGAAMMVPSEFQSALNPMNIALEGRRLEERAVDQYVRKQIDLIPEEIRDNLWESARLAVFRKTRLRDPDDPEAGAKASSDNAAGGSATETEPGVPAASLEQDRAEFDRRVQLEYTSLLRAYVMGMNAAGWFRTEYDPRDRQYDDAGRPVLKSVAPSRVWSEAPSAAASTTGGPGMRGMPGGMMGPGGPGMMGGGRGPTPPGARGGMGGPGVAGTGAPSTPMAAGVATRPGG